jgi:hypothetical protein
MMHGSTIKNCSFTWNQFVGKAVEGRVQLYLYISCAFSLYCTLYYFGAIRLTFLAIFEILASFKGRLFSHSQVEFLQQIL